LRRQHDGDQQRERVDVFEFALRRRVGGGEPGEDFLGARQLRSLGRARGAAADGGCGRIT
jgi:hypothetical protein